MRVIIATILFLSIIVESTIISFPVTLLVITLIVSIFEEEAVYWAFTAGLILDIFAFKLLGISSLFFLTIVWTKERFRKKFHQGWMYYQLFTLIAVIALYSLLNYHHIDIWELVITSILAGLILFGIRNILPKEGSSKKLSI